jgi:hypothetical protein
MFKVFQMLIKTIGMDQLDGPRHYNLLIFDFSLAGSQDENTNGTNQPTYKTAKLKTWQDRFDGQYWKVQATIHTPYTELSSIQHLT